MSNTPTVYYQDPSMFDKLIDLFVQFIEVFQFWRVVDQWEKGIVLRLGKFHRMARPGLMFIWPLHIEQLFVEDIFRKVTTLAPQSLTTADGVGVVASPVVTYKVVNVKKVILQAGGHEEAIIAVVPGKIGELIMGANWTDLNTEEFRATLTTASDEAAQEWGVEILEVRFANLVKARSYRLFNENNHK